MLAASALYGLAPTSTATQTTTTQSTNSSTQPLIQNKYEQEQPKLYQDHQLNHRFQQHSNSRSASLPMTNSVQFPNYLFTPSATPISSNPTLYNEPASTVLNKLYLGEPNQSTLCEAHTLPLHYDTNFTPTAEASSSSSQTIDVPPDDDATYLQGPLYTSESSSKVLHRIFIV